MGVRKVAVGDIMTRTLVTAHPSTNLFECARKMVKQRVGCLLLTEGTRLKGILTQKDILWAITKKPELNLKSIHAQTIATRKVAVIKPSADLAQAFQKMREVGFRRLPVIARGQLLGLLTIKDILKVEPSLYTKTGDLMEVREESRKLESALDQTSESFCEECGAFADLLLVNARALCADCRDELY